MGSKKKVMTVVGTRPEIIRLSEVIKKLDRHLDHVLVHTGQNYDYELSEIFFSELGIRRPDHFLDADRSTLGATVGDIIKKSEEVLKKEKPGALLVLGDTNSCLAAYMARRMHIPIYHMEAGNRCYDFRVPEETNRRIIDHIADVNLVYTEHARRHLLSEGLPHNRIFLTGSPMREVLDVHREKIKKSDILTALDLKEGDYFLISAHREENVDEPENLKNILEVLNRLADTYQLPVIVSTHPRTRQRLDELGKGPLPENKLIRFLKPFGFIDYNHLQMHARCVLSDSGTISEESAILNFPAVTLRNAMERPEARDAGTIILTGLQPDTIVHSIEILLDSYNSRENIQIPFEYQIVDSASRVLNIIAGLR